MSKKKETLRKCIMTNERFPKEDLLRIVKTKDGNIVVDPIGKKQGRGAYVQKSDLDIAKLKKSGALQRSFRMKINNDIFEEIERYLIDGE